MFFFQTVFALVVLALSSFGFGAALAKWVFRVEAPFSFHVATGIAFLIFSGGVLNAFGIAYPAPVEILLATGIVLFVVSLVSRFRKSTASHTYPVDAAKNKFSHYLAPLLLVSLASLYLAFNVLPSAAFNHGDDFLTYIPRVERMLQTGTLANNPYDSLGQDSLGAQSFMQGFTLLWLPADYLPGFDTVFCFWAAGMLLVDLGRKFRLNWVYPVTAILVFVAINPQAVNISALYSGVVIMLGMFLASCLLVERQGTVGGENSFRQSILVGLFVSALIALKTTLAFFAAIYLVLFLIGLYMIVPGRRDALAIIVIVVFTSVMALLPWLSLHLPHLVSAAIHYMAAFKGSLSANTAISGSANIHGATANSLFSLGRLSWGGSILGYWYVIIALLVMCGYAAYSIWQEIALNHRQPDKHSFIVVSICLAAIGDYFLNGMLFDFESAVRYSCPVLIAAFPFALVLTSRQSESSRNLFSFSRLSIKLVPALVIGSGMGILMMFATSLSDRAERIYTKHTTASIPIKNDDLDYTRFVLSENTRKIIRDIQYRTEPGETILAWISMPLNLDFSRNNIYTITDLGITNPWLDIPDNGNAAELVSYFRRQGVRYLLFEYRSGGMRKVEEYRAMMLSSLRIYQKVGERSLYMRDMLLSIMFSGALLYNQHGIALYDLDQYAGSNQVEGSE